jgi:hypothetical protein
MFVPAVVFFVLAVFAMGALGYRAHLAMPVSLPGQTYDDQPVMPDGAFCNRCGTLSSDHQGRCPSCGEPLDANVDEEKTLRTDPRS